MCQISFQFHHCSQPILRINIFTLKKPLNQALNTLRNSPYRSVLWQTLAHFSPAKGLLTRGLTCARTAIFEVRQRVIDITFLLTISTRYQADRWDEEQRTMQINWRYIISGGNYPNLTVSTQDWNIIESVSNWIFRNDITFKIYENVKCNKNRVHK